MKGLHDIMCPEVQEIAFTPMRLYKEKPKFVIWTFQLRLTMV